MFLFQKFVQTIWNFRCDLWYWLLCAMPVFVDIHNCRMQVPGTFSYQREREKCNSTSPPLQWRHLFVSHSHILPCISSYNYVIYIYKYKSTHWFSMSLFCTYNTVHLISLHCIASPSPCYITWHCISLHYLSLISLHCIASHHITLHAHSHMLFFSVTLSLYMHMFTHRHTSHLHPSPSACVSSDVVR